MKKLGEIIIRSATNVAAEKLEIRAELLRSMADSMNKEAQKIRYTVEDAIENYQDEENIHGKD